MAKQSKGKSQADKARKRLTKAQLDLHVAQEKRARAVARAQAEVESARLRGAVWVERATERVERRAGDLARAEARLLSATAVRAHVQPTPAQSNTSRSRLSENREPVRQILTPHDPGRHIGREEVQPVEVVGGDSIVLPGGLTTENGRSTETAGEPDNSGTALS